MRGIAAISVILVIALGAWSILGPGAGAPVADCAPATHANADRSVSDGADGGRLSWEGGSRLSGDAEFDEEIVLDVAAFGEGFVAVGRRTVGARSGAFALHSADGVEWSGDTSGEAFPEIELSSLVVAGSRLFAIGSVSTDDRGGSRAAVWFSDDGIGWTEATGPFDETRPAALAGRDGELLMTGRTARTDELVTWRSPDGAAWEAAAPVLPMSAGEAHIADLAAAEDGWVGVGSASRGADAAAAAVVWRSTDGRTWTCQVLDPGPYANARAWQLHRAGEAWLAVGDATHGCWYLASCPGFPITWSAADGAWTGGHGSARGGPGAGATVYAADARGFVAVQFGRAWTSVDGARWLEVSAERNASSPPGPPETVVVDGNRLVAGGSASNDLGDDADGWLAAGELRR